MEKNSLKQKVRDGISLAKKYWHVPAEGNYVPYKEIAALSGAGFGVHWATLLPSTIGLSASNFLVGASIGLKPMDLQIMLMVANFIGIPLGIFRSWYYDNHHLKGGKFLPFIRRTAFPIVLISMIFVWLPYENWDYIVKAVVVEVMYLLLSIFLCFYNESYTYFQQIVTPNTQERVTVMSISQIVYSMAPTLTNLFIPLLAPLTGGLNNIWTYRIIYPVFTVIGLVFSVVFFRKVKERLILPKKPPEPVRIIDAVREVAKNKYYWLTQSAGWVVFLESGYGVVLGWTFVYAFGGKYQASLGIANTVIGNAALWSMMLAPFAIKYMGKRNLLITMNSINVVVLILLYFTYKNILIVCALWYFNSFINTFWNIIQHGISADMRDYHQWKTGVRIDGLFGPLGMIGTFIGMFTGLFYPYIYEKMGLLEDYNVLYDDNMRNSLFEVLILCSAVGAFLNLIPFIFYDLTEDKHKGYVDVLKIRAMFEDFGNGVLEDGQLEESMDIIKAAKAALGKEKKLPDKSALKKAKALPKKTDEEKEYRLEQIRKAKEALDAQRTENLNIVTAPFIMEELGKFSTARYQRQLEAAKNTFARGEFYIWDNLSQEKAEARALPKKTKEEKEIRSDAIALCRQKKESVKLIEKYGKENLRKPDEAYKEEIRNRETTSFLDSMKQRKELKQYAKAVSLYNRALAPYTKAKSLLEQCENYTHLDELEERYAELLNRAEI